MSIKKIKRSKMAVLCVVVGLMLPFVFAPSALAATGPTLSGAYTNTGATLPAGPVYSSSTFKLVFSNNVTVDTYWAANQACVTLRDGSGNTVASTVTRVGTGLNTDPEKANIYVTPSAPLVAGAQYTIRIAPELTANNGGQMGTEAIVGPFTVATGAQSIVTNHMTVDSYLTVAFGASHLDYLVSGVTSTPSASTTVSVLSNDGWTRTVSWTNLLGADHGATILAADFGGVSDLNGALSAAGPNTYTGGPTTSYLETLTFTYNNAASNPRADSYTGTVTVAVTPAL